MKPPLDNRGIVLAVLVRLRGATMASFGPAALAAAAIALVAARGARAWS